MRTGIDHGGDLVEMRLHGRRVGEGHHEAGALAEPRADRPEDVGPSGALVVRGSGPRSAPGPAAGQLVLLADPGFVLEPDLDTLAAGMPGSNLRHLGGEVFLNASITSGSWA